MSDPHESLLVVADDRTGALETAGASADAGLLSVATSYASATPVPPYPCHVIDIATRHLDAPEAGRRAVDAAGTSPGGRRDAHKIDSTLRGNWAAELVARFRATGKRTVVIPAFPSAGRTCVGGIVRDHDTPVAEGAAGRDPLRSIGSSRPAEHLHAAGASSVTEVGDAPALGRWFESETAFAVCDAAADVELVLLAEQWRDHADIVFAGTAASIGAAARVIAGPSGRRTDPPRVDGPMLVVSGSLHPATRAQIAVLRATPGRHIVLTAPDRSNHDVDPDEAALTARLLAAAARRELGRRRFAAVLLVGGDTAAAFLGDAALLVGGTVEPDVPWCRSVDGSGPLVLTKPGGFGDEQALARIVGAILEP